MRAFVTGSTGLLGNNLVRALLAEGYAVRALVRSRAKAGRQFAGLNVELVEGDMADVAGFAEQLQGCEVLFHTAAYFREYYGPGDHWKTLEAINIRGTLGLLGEAERRGVRRAVYVSSSGTIHSEPGKPGDETTIARPEALGNLYFRSKAVADLEVAKFLHTSGLEVVTVMPGWMFGPGDAAPTGAGDLVLRFVRRQLPVLIDGGATVADARDVAAAMIAAVRRGRPGQQYAVAGRFMNLTDWARLMQQVSGVPAPRLRPPQAVLEAVAWAGEAAARLTGQTPQFPLEGIRTLHAKHLIRSAKAERELGASFRPLEETLRDTYQWFRANGYLEGAAAGRRVEGNA